MSDRKKASGLELGPEVKPRALSPGFVEALAQAGARDSLVQALRDENKEPEPQENDHAAAAG